MNVFLNAVLIPTSILGITLFGMKSTGAAIATLTSFLFGFAFIRYRAHKILGTTYNPRIFKHLFAAGVTSVVAYAFNVYVYHFVRFYEVLGASLVFLGLYVVILLLMRELTWGEIKDIYLKLFSILRG